MVFSNTYKISKQKNLEGLDGWMSLDAKSEDDIYDRPPMIESPATTRKTFLPSTFDAYATSISDKGVAEESPSSSSPRSVAPSTTTSTTPSPSLDLDGLWEWEDEEFTACGLPPTSPALEETADLVKLEKFHNMLQSSPELTLGLCRLLEKAHWGVGSAFERYDRENGVKMSVVDGELIVGFRGTCTVWDLISDLRIGTVAGPHGAKVHKGFHRILKTINQDGAFLREIQEAVRTTGAKRVIFTGYSLGGAVASLSLLEHGDALLEAGVDVRAITFGCPRFADNKDLQKIPRRLTTKIVNTYIEGDPIPLSLTSFVPWHRVNYVHIGNAVLIENKGKGVTVREQGRKQSSDSSIKWWGLYRAPWSHHLTESYDRFLQLQSIQLNFQLMMKRAPNFMTHLLKVSETDISTAAEDLEKFIHDQRGILGAVDRLRSAVEPLRASGDLDRLPAKISQELLGIALIEGFFRSLSVGDDQGGRGVGVDCQCGPREVVSSHVAVQMSSTTPEATPEPPAHSAAAKQAAKYPWQEPYIAAMMLAKGQSSIDQGPLSVLTDVTTLDTDLDTAAFIDKIQQMVFEASRDRGLIRYQGYDTEESETKATPSGKDEYDLLLTYSVQGEDIPLKESPSTLGKKRLPFGTSALRHRSPGSNFDPPLKASIEV